MGGDEDEAWLSEGRVLRMATLAELEVFPEIGWLSDSGGSEAERYKELRRALHETAESWDSSSDGFGEYTVACWRETLLEVADYRVLLANNIEVEHRELLEGLVGRLRTEQEELGRQIAALEALEASAEAHEEDAREAKALTRLRDLEKVIRDPNPFEIAKFVIDPPGTSDVIVEGVAMMGRHALAIDLAGYGFRSLDELEQSIARCHQRTSDLLWQVQWAHHRRSEGERLKALRTF